MAPFVFVSDLAQFFMCGAGLRHRPGFLQVF